MMRRSLREALGRVAARAQGASRPRGMCSGARTDGFTEALPRGDLIAPVIFTSVYGFSWLMADEGRIQSLAEQVDINTDPNKSLTPNQLFHHIWPYVAGSLGTLFDSVACKFSTTKDMEWLCTVALNDDTNAAVALSLLTPPAENSSAFVRAIFEHKGAMRRVNEIVQIYKTLPREQHDDVVVNACILAAKVAAMEDLRPQGLELADFVWMVPPDKAQLYSQYGIEGLGALWNVDRRAFLCSGGVLRLAELVDGPTLRPTKGDSSAINQLLAHRLFAKLAAERDSLLAEAGKAEASLAAEVRAAGSSKPVTTIWQRAGVHRGETEQEMSARVRSGELDAVRGGMQALASFAPRQPLQYLEQYASALVIGTAGLLGALYGGARGYARAWWMDVTPSVCRELAGHVAMRSAIGSMLLVGFFEAAPWLKKQALTSANRKEVDDFRHPEALSQLVAVDLAYLGAIAAVNFLFPYVLIPVALNPAQLLVLPSDAPPPPPPQRIADAQADAAK